MYSTRSPNPFGLKPWPYGMAMTPPHCSRQGPRLARLGARAASHNAWPKAHWACNLDSDTLVHNLGLAQSATSRIGT